MGGFVVLGGLGLLFAIFFALLKFSSFWFLFYGRSLDKFSFLLLVLVFWLFVLLVFLGIKYKIAHKSFYVYMANVVLLLFILSISFSVNNFLGFYIFFEVSLLPLFFLILGWGYQAERLQASFYLLLYTIVGSLPLLRVLVFLNFKSSLFLPSLRFFTGWGSRLFYVGGIFVMVSILIKLPIYGLHLWLPKAHVEAPVAGSIILAAVILKLGVYGTYRAFFFLLSPILLQNHLWAILLLIGAVLRSIVASRQTDIKSLVAFSSIGHIGVLIAGLLTAFSCSVKGAFIIVFAHGFCSSALFYLVNFLYERIASRQIRVVRGQGSLMYGLRFWWFLFLIINFSAPPFLRLAGEIVVIFQMVAINFSFIVVLMVVRFLVAFFSLILFRSICHGKIPQYWGFPQPRDFFFISLLFHTFPIFFFIIKLEILWYCWFSLNIKHCNVGAKILLCIWQFFGPAYF